MRLFAIKNRLRLPALLVAIFIVGGSVTSMAEATIINLPTPTVVVFAQTSLDTCDPGVVPCAANSYSGSMSSSVLTENASATGGLGVAGSATATVGITPAPYVSVSTDGTGGGAAQIAYYFAVSGPQNVLVPVTLSGTNTIEPGGDQFASVEESMWLGEFQGQVADGCFRSDFTLNDCQQFTGSAAFDLSASVLSNTVYMVQLYAGVAYDCANCGPAVASIDPILSIDPTFVNASDFSLIISSGVGNSPASVPEPGTLDLFEIALVGLVAARRKRDGSLNQVRRSD